MITFDNLSAEQLEEILSVLLVLAKRKDGSNVWWCTPDYKLQTLTCNICLKELNCPFDDDRDEVMIKHIFFHLKESNLTVFI